MKKILGLLTCALVVVATVVFAQSTASVTLRLPSGDKPVTMVQQGGATYFSAGQFFAALGGTIAQDAGGSRVIVGKLTGAFGTESRFGVVGDELIEMPVAPVRIEDEPFVPLAYLQGFVKASGQELLFDLPTRLLTLRAAAPQTAAAQISLIEVEGTSKLVVQLSSTIDYTVSREPAGYRIRFRGDIRPPFTDQPYENPHVARITFGAGEMFITLASKDVAGDAYRLDNPFRVVMDFRAGAPPVGPGTVTLPGSRRAIDPPGIRTIVLDPGHGGKEVGAVGANGLFEKDATLAICRRLSALLSSKLNTRVVLTRTDDSVVPLDQRTAIANQYKADLFLSVHLNASVQRGARGSETYFLSLEASDDLARTAAERENATTGAATSQPLGTSSDLRLILWDLAQQDYLAESSRLAEVVQEEMNRASGVQNRGVKQAPFKVLVGATMPAALVEVAFISNPEEEAKLKDEAFQNQIAETLLRAVERYKREYETKIGVYVPATRVPEPAAGVLTPAKQPEAIPAKREGAE